jgi:hypothetical protein
MRTALAVAALALAFNASAATLTLGVVQRADDERLVPQRVALAYPGQLGGPLHAAVEMAVSESRFELDAAMLRVSRKDTWDPIRDTTPIIQVSGVTFGVLVPAASAWRSVDDLLGLPPPIRTSCSHAMASPTSTCPTREAPSRWWRWPRAR